MLRTSIALALATFALGAIAAQPVATLGKVEGTVMINQGERYLTAVAGTPLAPGDRLMVMAGSKAEVVFGSDQCVLPLGANVVTTIPATSTCAGGIADIKAFGPSYAQAVGSSATDATTTPNQQDDNDNRKLLLWFAGGTAAAAIVYYQTRDRNRERTASR